MSDSLTKAHDEDDRARLLCDKFNITHGMVKTYGGFMSPEDVVVAYAKIRNFPMGQVPTDNVLPRDQLKFIEQRAT